jgi:hypothetical protein
MFQFYQILKLHSNKTAITAFDVLFRVKKSLTDQLAIPK